MSDPGTGCADPLTRQTPSDSTALSTTALSIVSFARFAQGSSTSGLPNDKSSSSQARTSGSFLVFPREFERARGRVDAGEHHPLAARAMPVVQRHVGRIAELDEQRRTRLVRRVEARSVDGQIVEEQRIARLRRQGGGALDRVGFGRSMMVGALGGKRAELVRPRIDAQAPLLFGCIVEV